MDSQYEMTRPALSRVCVSNWKEGHAFKERQLKVQMILNLIQINDNLSIIDAKLINYAKNLIT